MSKETTDHEITEKIVAIKEKTGSELLILTHHYQRKEIVDLGDHRGDSFGLSQKAAADKAARFIVFCGVHFMAESAPSGSTIIIGTEINLINRRPSETGVRHLKTAFKRRLS